MEPVDFLKNVLCIADDRLLRELVSRCEVRMVKKGEWLILQGQKPVRLYFLIDGIFRGALIGINGKDITDCIVSTCGAPLMANSNLSGTAQIGIEALTKATVLSMALQDVMVLFPKFPALSQMYQDFLVWSNNMHWELKVIIYQYSALQRYQWFLKTYPNLIDRISHKHIASFLNMAPETLSKLIHTSENFIHANEPSVAAADDERSPETMD